MIEMRKDTCEWNIICEECKKAIKAGKEYMQVEIGKYEHTLCMKCYNELGEVIGKSIEEEEERVYKIKEIVEAVTYAKEKGLYMAIYLPKKEGDEIRSIVRDSKEGSIWCKRFNTEEIESLICDILYDSEMNEISI